MLAHTFSIEETTKTCVLYDIYNYICGNIMSKARRHRAYSLSTNTCIVSSHHHVIWITYSRVSFVVFIPLNIKFLLSFFPDIYLPGEAWSIQGGVLPVRDVWRVHGRLAGAAVQLLVRHPHVHPPSHHHDHSLHAHFLYYCQKFQWLTERSVSIGY